MLCKTCNRRWVLPNDVTKPRKRIAQKKRLAIYHDLGDKSAEVTIAKKHHVSHMTVSRLQNEFCEESQPQFGVLPKRLCFDEFKSTSDAEGAMSFIAINGDDGSIVTLLENRQLHALRNYFKNYTPEALAMVEEICMDMYTLYVACENVSECESNC